MSAPFVHELRVRYGECDPQQIVFNANYFLYFDVAFTELWREAIGPWQDMVERGIDAVVAEANARFRAPARFDDVLSLRAQVDAPRHDEHHDAHRRDARRRAARRRPAPARVRGCADVEEHGAAGLGARRACGAFAAADAEQAPAAT